MMTEKRTLGPTETRLLNRLAADGHVVFSTAQARKAFGNGGQGINKLLYNLTRKRWLLRLEKGKYLILPLEAGMEGLYSAHEFVIAAHLVQPYAIAYASALSLPRPFRPAASHCLCGHYPSQSRSHCRGIGAAFPVYYPHAPQVLRHPDRDD